MVGACAILRTINGMRQDKLIWFAIVFSTFIYAAIIYTLYPNPAGAFEDAVKQQKTLILYGLAVMEFLFAMVAPSFMANRPARLRMTVALALFESCAIFGLLAAFLAQDWRLFVAPWILALLGMWRVYPSGVITETPAGPARV